MSGSEYIRILLENKMKDDWTGIRKDEKEEKDENQDIEKTDLDLANLYNSGNQKYEI